MATRIYKTPFAATGDKEVLATADQPDGKVSLQAGWTPDYELPNDNANYRPVGRAEMNGIIGEITEGLGEVQLNGFAQWQAIDGGWPLGAFVRAGDTVYRSEVNSNTTDPGAGGAGWSQPFSGRLLGVRVFEAAGTSTYTPTPGTKSVVVEVQGGGGAGGGTPVTGAGQCAIGGPGGGGSYARGRFTSGFAGVTVTVGAGGTGVVNASGSAGGTSSFGALISAPGGVGGTGAQGVGPAPRILGGNQGGAAPSGGNIVSSRGQSGSFSAALDLGTNVIGGAGGASPFGAGGSNTANTFGSPATGYGGGGGGVGAGQSVAAVSGGNGFRGIVIIWEYA